MIGVQTRAIRYDRRNLSIGGDAAWSVEAADAEARRHHKRGATGCNKLLALLRAHHDYGAGELMLKGGRRLSTGTITNG